MCNSSDRKPEKPILPEVDLDFDDPMMGIPSDLRNRSELPNHNRCSRCGQKASEDELVSNSGHHRSCPPLYPAQQYKPYHNQDRPGTFKTPRPVFEGELPDLFQE